MDSRDKLYTDHEAFTDFIAKGFEEDLSPTETITVSALERQKAQLQGQKVKVEQQLKDILEKINTIDAQVGRMKAT